MTNGRLFTDSVTSWVWRGPQFGRYATFWARDTIGRRKSRETVILPLFTAPPPAVAVSERWVAVDGSDGAVGRAMARRVDMGRGWGKAMGGTVPNKYIVTVSSFSHTSLT